MTPPQKLQKEKCKIKLKCDTMSPVNLAKIKNSSMFCGASGVDRHRFSYVASGDVSDKGRHSVTSESNAAWFDLYFYYETHFLI